MPIYEYRCTTCPYEYEQRRSMAAMDEPSECPKCGEMAGERKVSMSFAVVGVSRTGGDFDLGDLGDMGDFGNMDGMGMDEMGGMPPGMGGMPPGMGGMPPGLGGF